MYGMFSSDHGGLLSGLHQRLGLGPSRPRRRLRCSISKAVLALETRTLPAATPIGGPIDLDSSGAIAVDADGDFVVAWQQSTIDQHQSLVEADIMARRYHADGSPDGDAFLVNTITANFQQRPSIAMNPAGEFVIAWSCQVGTYDQVELHAQRYGSDGVAEGTEFRVDATDSHSTFTAINLAMYDSGAFVATWDRYGGPNISDVFVRRYDATGVALSGETLVYPGGHFIASPDVATMPDGGYLLTWTDDGTLLGRRFDAAGQAVGSGFVGSYGYAQQPSIATDADGNFVVAWTQNTDGWSVPQAYGRRFTAAGVALGDAFPLSSEPTPDEGAPLVAMSPDGDFVIAWSKGPSFLNHQLVVRAFNSEGTPLGDEFAVDPGATGNQAFGGFAMTASGEFIVNWTDRDASESFAQRFLLNLTPTDITLSPGSVAENSVTGTSVGTLTAIDADGDESFTYELVSGTGDGDNAAFQIVGNELRTAALFDYESKTSYTVRVRATDLTGASVEKSLTIQIINVRDDEFVTLSNDTIDENQPKNTLVGLLGLNDAPEGAIQYRLVSGAGGEGNDSFKISGNKLLTKSWFDAEAQSSYSVRVEARDAEGNVTIQVLTINIDDVNEAPTRLTLSPGAVRKGSPSGTTVGQLSAFDADNGSTFTFSLVSGRGDSGNDQFAVVGNSLVTAGNLGKRSSYTVRIRATDQGGASFESIVRIKVTRDRSSSTISLAGLWSTLTRQPG